MRIDRIIVHCSDSDRKAHDDIEVIRQWHTENNWSGPDEELGTDDDVGYNYFIKKNGEIQKGRPVGTIGAHTRGHNKGSIGICLSGRHLFPGKQKDSFFKLIKELLMLHNLKSTDVYGHYELDPRKTCPNMDANYIRRMIL